MLNQVYRLLEKFEKARVDRDSEIVLRLNDCLRQLHVNGIVDQVELQKQLQGLDHQQSVAYTNLVMLGGYAGFFAFWQLTKDFVGPATASLVALLLLVSLMLFVGFEVFKMVSRALSIDRLNRILDSMQDQRQRLETYQAAKIEYSRLENRLWICFLVPTVLSGFGAGLIMTIVLAQHLTGTLVTALFPN